MLDSPENQFAIVFFTQNNHGWVGRSVAQLAHQSQDGVFVSLGACRPQIEQNYVRRLANLAQLRKVPLGNRTCYETLSQGAGNRLAQPGVLRQKANANHWQFHYSRSW